MTDEQQPQSEETSAATTTETPMAPAAMPEAAPIGVPAAPPAAGPMRTGPRRKRDFKGKYMPRRRVCAFCADKSARIDYKDAGRLRRFLSDRGKIEPRRKTGTCAKHQRVLSTALKRARFIALLPYSADHIRVMGGPSLGRG